MILVIGVVLVVGVSLVAVNVIFNGIDIVIMVIDILKVVLILVIIFIDDKDVFKIVKVDVVLEKGIVELIKVNSNMGDVDGIDMLNVKLEVIVNYKLDFDKLLLKKDIVAVGIGIVIIFYDKKGFVYDKDGKDYCELIVI